jgi:hypothetical protein
MNWSGWMTATPEEQESIRSPGAALGPPREGQS